MFPNLSIATKFRRLLLETTAVQWLQSKAKLVIQYYNRLLQSLQWIVGFCVKIYDRWLVPYIHKTRTRISLSRATGFMKSNKQISLKIYSEILHLIYSHRMLQRTRERVRTRKSISHELAKAEILRMIELPAALKT